MKNLGLVFAFILAVTFAKADIMMFDTKGQFLGTVENSKNLVYVKGETRGQGTFYDVEAFDKFYNDTKETPAVNLKGAYAEFSTLLVRTGNTVTASTVVYTDTLENNVAIAVPFNGMDDAEKATVVSHLHTHANVGNDNDPDQDRRRQGVSTGDNLLDPFEFTNPNNLNVVVDADYIYFYNDRGEFGTFDENGSKYLFKVNR